MNWGFVRKYIIQALIPGLHHSDVLYKKLRTVGLVLLQNKAGWLHHLFSVCFWGGFCCTEPVKGKPFPSLLSDFLQGQIDCVAIKNPSRRLPCWLQLCSWVLPGTRERAVHLALKHTLLQSGAQDTDDALCSCRHFCTLLCRFVAALPRGSFSPVLGLHWVALPWRGGPLCCQAPAAAWLHQSRHRSFSGWHVCPSPASVQANYFRGLLALNQALNVCNLSLALGWICMEICKFMDNSCFVSSSFLSWFLCEDFSAAFFWPRLLLFLGL